MKIQTKKFYVRRSSTSPSRNWPEIAGKTLGIVLVSAATVFAGKVGWDSLSGQDPVASKPQEQVETAEQFKNPTVAERVTPLRVEATEDKKLVENKLPLSSPDIIACLDTVRKQSKEFGIQDKTPRDELKRHLEYCLFELWRDGNREVPTMVAGLIVETAIKNDKVNFTNLTEKNNAIQKIMKNNSTTTIRILAIAAGGNEKGFIDDKDKLAQTIKSRLYPELPLNIIADQIKISRSNAYSIGDLLLQLYDQIKN